MEVNFDKNSWHARLYWAGYTKWEKLPKNLCPYFWKIVLLILLFPFTWIAYCSQDFRREPLGIKVLITLTSYAMLWALGFPAFTILNVMGVGLVTNCLVSYTIGAALVAGLLWVLGWIFQKLSGILLDFWMHNHNRSLSGKVSKPKKDNILLAFLVAKKHKYCPVINWHDETQEKKEEPVSETS